MAILPFVEDGVISEQAEGIHVRIRDASAQVWRVDMRTLQLLQLRILQLVEGICRLLCLHKLVK